MRLTPKFALFALVALVVPILSILFASAFFIYKNRLVDNWRYLEQISAVIIDDITETEDRYRTSVSNLALDEYLSTKLYVHRKYRDYLSDATIAWDNVPLRDYLTSYALANNIETSAIYESTGREFKRVLLLGNTANVPYSFGINDAVRREEVLQYGQYLNSLYLNCTTVVYDDDDVETGLILFQRAFDGSFFYNFSIKYDIDIGLVLDGDVVLDTSNGAYRDRIKKLLASRDTRSYFRSGDTVFQIVLQPIAFGRDFDGVIATISKGHPVFGRIGIQFGALTLVGIASIVVAVFFFVLWGTQLIRTLRALFEGTNAVSNGNLDHEITVNRSDELGILADNFNAMVRTIHDDQVVLEQRNARLRLMNHYIDAVFQSLDVNTLVIDTSRSIVLMNQNARNSLGPYPDEDQVDLFAIPFFRDRQDEFHSVIDDVLENGVYRNLPNITRNTEVYSVDLFPITDGDSTISGVIIVMIDITYRETMKRELLKSQQVAAIGQISAALAHEINNPISIIQNHVELVQTKKLTEEEEAVFLGRIHSEILRINNLIDNLLQFSRNESLSTTTIDINLLLRQIFIIFTPMLEKKRIRYEVVNDAAGTMIVGNLTLLKQLFLNIVKNAVESIRHDHGSLVASLQEEENILLITIVDNGMGMSESVVSRIFDPFFTSKLHPNVGLGLSLCRDIVTKHGGSIEIASQEGEGTSVTVKLPQGESP